MKNVVRAFKMLPSWRKLAAGIFITGITNAAIVVTIPLVVQRVIDRLIQNIGRTDASVLLVLFPLLLWVILRVLLIAIEWITEIVSDNAMRAVVVSFREKCVGKLENLSMAYYEKRRAGQIASEVNQSPFKFGDWVQDTTENNLPTMLRAVFVLVVLGFKFLPLAFVVLALVALYAWFVFRTMARNRKWWADNRKTINEWSGVQTENIVFASDIRALGIKKQRGELYRSYLHAHDLNLYNMFKYQHRRNFIGGLLAILMYALPLGVFTFRALQGLQSPSDIYVLAVYLTTLSEASSRLARNWAATVNVNDSLGETLDILDQADSVQDPPNPELLKKIKTVAFKDLSFSYGEGKTEAVSDIDLEVSRGQTIALVGRSGSGKSTLIKLLLRFYDPTKGMVTINDTPLPQYSQDSIRSKIGVVMQDVALFNDTVANNIAIASSGVSLNQIMSAAKIAHAHEFIEALPEGYNTFVGERGIKLSGGEKQRVSIARAILRNPEIVILDEATSALDSESEKLVQAGLKKLLHGRTAIIIAHRLSTITHADKIVVLDKGKIVQTGAYSELKAVDGPFATLLKHQEL